MGYGLLVCEESPQELEGCETNELMFRISYSKP